MRHEDPSDPATIVGIETGQTLQNTFIVFRFMTTVPGQKEPSPTPWLAIPPDGAKVLLNHLSTEIGRLALDAKSSGPKKH